MYAIFPTFLKIKTYFADVFKIKTYFCQRHYIKSVVKIKYVENVKRAVNKKNVKTFLLLCIKG